MDEDKNELEALIDTCKVVSYEEFEQLKDNANTFFVRRGFNSNKTKFTEEIDWNTLFSPNVDTYLERVGAWFSPKSASKSRITSSGKLMEERPDLSAPTPATGRGQRKDKYEQHDGECVNISSSESESLPATRKRGRRKGDPVAERNQASDPVNAEPDETEGCLSPKRRGRPKKALESNASSEGENLPDVSHKLDQMSKKLEARRKNGRVPTAEITKFNTGAVSALTSRSPSPEKIEEESEADISDDHSSDFEDSVSDLEAEKKKVPATPRKRQRVATPMTPTAKTPGTSPRKNKSPIKDILRTPTRKIVIKAPRSAAALPHRPSMLVTEEGVSPHQQSPHQQARGRLHVSTVPDSLPCRENEFSQIFLALESAINAETGSCIYVSGTPGTGKTATVREVILQLQLRCQDGELPEFSFIEINGMKLINPQEAYEILWEEISGQRVSSSNAVALLEKEFKIPNQQRVPVLVLMDEMDQLVTKSQGVMYNFFNWPTFRNSKLIVVAVANTMDLPERMLSNKISSRLGLTRIQFPGYNHDQLREIIESRLLNVEGNIVKRDAIEFASRKVASVSGDARRVLDICRRAVDLAELDSAKSNPTEPRVQQVEIQHIKQAIDETTSSPMFLYLQGLPLACKIFLSAVLARIRRSGVVENSLGDILEETQRLCKLSNRADKLLELLYGEGQVRMTGFLKAVTELVEGGILVQQSMRGERSGRIRLTVAEEDVKMAFKNDQEVEGMI